MELFNTLKFISRQKLPIITTSCTFMAWIFAEAREKILDSVWFIPNHMQVRRTKES